MVVLGTCAESVGGINKSQKEARGTPYESHKVAALVANQPGGNVAPTAHASRDTVADLRQRLQQAEVMEALSETKAVLHGLKF